MACRALLLHIAVDKGANARSTFEQAIDHLVAAHLITANSKALASHVKSLGNDANHRIKIMDRKSALASITLTEALLKMIYEYPAQLPMMDKLEDGTE